MGQLVLPQAWKIAELSLRELVRYNRLISEEQCQNGIRIAILGDCATQHYTECLQAALRIRGYWPVVYQSEFNSFNQELLDPGSSFHNHEPEVVILLNCVQALQERFRSLEKVGSFTDSILAEYSDRWNSIRSKSNCLILQHNLCLPLDFTFGNSTQACSRSFANSVTKINQMISCKSLKEKDITIIDTESQAAFYGKNSWLNEGLWCQAKQALSPLFLPPLVKSVTDAILKKNGFSVKCVVLDLDNTLWGGILGDVGINGIEIGAINEIGMSFSRFQNALRLLKDRGILLAVCSKNDIGEVKEVFKHHPDMVLREEDIACFKANYRDKVQNILAIQEKLNLGLDTFVFLDDSPFERSFVRESLPDVQVPDLPEDPTEYAKYLAKWNLFESSDFSNEDSKRTIMYRNDAERSSIKRAFPDLVSYLRSLEMKAEFEPFNEFTLPRAAQLIQRSNQFNLTTHRYNEAELQEYSVRVGEYLTFTVRLEDRIGDNGIIALMIGKISGEVLEIDSWVMSCRVLGREIEECTFGYLANKAKELGIRTILGVYERTEKNGIVSNLYTELGFAEADSTLQTTKYLLDLGSYKPNNIDFIAITEKHNYV